MNTGSFQSKVKNAFRSYKKHSLAAVHKREDYLSRWPSSLDITHSVPEHNTHRLPKEHQRLLRKHGYQETLDDLKEAVDLNHVMISKIMADVEEMFENVSHHVKEESDPRGRPSQLDMDKVQRNI